MEKRILTVVLIVVASGCISIPPTATVDAEVTEVIDGDTATLEWKNKTEEVRFKGIDTPEVNTENDPSDFEGVQSSGAGEECLRKWGENASEYTKSKILNKKVQLEFVPLPHLKRGSYGRLLGTIKYNSTDLNRELVRKGLARSYSENGPYINEERQAKLDMRGVWNCQMIS